MDKITFATNVPVEVALKFAEGKEVPSSFGGPQIMYTTDKGLMFLSPVVADKINSLRPQVGEPFTICKTEQNIAGGRKRIIWEVSKVGFPGDSPMDSAPAGVTSTDQGRGTNNHQTSAPQQNPTTPGPLAVPRVMPQGTKDPAHLERPKTKLEDALKTVVAACHAARLYAKEIGYEAMPPFTSEDIRTMANTLVIDSQRFAGGAR
jgi:hypothetical protein